MYEDYCCEDERGNYLVEAFTEVLNSKMRAKPFGHLELLEECGLFPTVSHGRHLGRWHLWAESGLWFE